MLALCKPTMHLLNFARGEIVDGAALKRAWDANKYSGKYICDFTDEACMGHSKFVCMPHLGASTEEAEENSAAMAADTMRIYLETGAIRHSVNFPNIQPQERQGYARLAVVHKNEPGILGQITTFLGSQKINITQQVNSSRGAIAYTLIDMEDCPADPAGLQQKCVDSCPSIISLRYISALQANELGQPGTFFFVKWAETKK
jgi:D-3-phosphoglycerate dehydrogenase